jgi:hypothetical protein
VIRKVSDERSGLVAGKESDERNYHVIGKWSDERNDGVIGKEHDEWNDHMIGKAMKEVAMWLRKVMKQLPCDWERRWWVREVTVWLGKEVMEQVTMW